MDENNDTSSSSQNKLQVYSFAYHPTINNLDDFQKSNRGIFPPSLYSLMEREHIHQTPGQPIIVRLQNITMLKDIYVTAHEFSAMEGSVYLSSHLMNENFVQEGDTVEVNVVSLPNITKLVLRPRCSRFAREIMDPKAALETAIISRYQVLSYGDILDIEGFELEITTLEPAEVVITNESDPEVEFLPCWEDIKKEQAEQDKKRVEEMEKQTLLQEKEKAKQEADRQRIIEETYQKTGHRFVPFGGTGRSLNGASENTSSTNSSTIMNGLPTQHKPNKPRSAKHLRDYSKFSGSGHKLGDS